MIRPTVPAILIVIAGFGAALLPSLVAGSLWPVWVVFLVGVVVALGTDAILSVSRRDLETDNWHYYEKDDGTIVHFRKEHIIAVIGDAAESVAAARV